ncbi:hypothetical protein [Acidovorax sp. sic0104]|uniref:hypothetical protein n=1 Tax=Acidovorax sp. sic0104 TaxID=2854784 RepID=UPI001C44457D|nr:hypothetical protein [Acidovorax sp. sic0104]MBV7541221.1 hypothetical protein [Acidovorax sp. sic0104]
MTTPRSLRKTEAYRLAVLCGTLGCAIAWGLVELLALQRSRYHLWRERHHTQDARLQR